MLPFRYQVVVMSDFVIWVPLVAVVSVGAWFLFFRTPTDSANPEFLKALNLFTDRVQAATLQLSADFTDIEAAFEALQNFAPNISEETARDIETLGKLWHETANQITEFGDQSVQEDSHFKRPFGVEGEVSNGRPIKLGFLIAGLG